jgi:hypothetical protein
MINVAMACRTGDSDRLSLPFAEPRIKPAHLFASRRKTSSAKPLVIKSAVQRRRHEVAPIDGGMKTR